MAVSSKCLMTNFARLPCMLSLVSNSSYEVSDILAGDIDRDGESCAIFVGLHYTKSLNKISIEQHC